MMVLLHCLVVVFALCTGQAETKQPFILEVDPITQQIAVTALGPNIGVTFRLKDKTTGKPLPETPQFVGVGTILVAENTKFTFHPGYHQMISVVQLPLTTTEKVKDIAIFPKQVNIKARKVQIPLNQPTFLRAH